MARSCHTGGGKTLETLYSGKHHKAGHNLENTHRPGRPDLLYF